MTHRSPPKSADESPAARRSIFEVNILEVNSEPAIEMTGPRLKWVLEDLFICIANTVVLPFLESPQDRSQNVTRDINLQGNLRKCLSINFGR